MTTCIIIGMLISCSNIPKQSPIEAAKILQTNQTVLAPVWPKGPVSFTIPYEKPKWEYRTYPKQWSSMTIFTGPFYYPYPFVFFSY